MSCLAIMWSDSQSPWHILAQLILMILEGVALGGGGVPQLEQVPMNFIRLKEDKCEQLGMKGFILTAQPLLPVKFSSSSLSTGARPHYPTLWNSVSRSQWLAGT